MTNKTVDPKQIAMLKDLMGVNVDLRDRFAMAALQSNLNQISGSGDVKAVAANCYEIADAMLEIRKSSKEE